VRVERCGLVARKKKKKKRALLGNDFPLQPQQQFFRSLFTPFFTFFFILHKEKKRKMAHTVFS
jgi:hypothetical protein